MSETVAASKPFEATSKSILGNTVGGASQKRIAASFDRSLHQPFRLDNKGMNKELTMKDQEKALNVSNQEIKIPEWWQKKGVANAHRTLTELQNHRRKGFIPDMSFDLDGDGIVGNRDLVISKLFDKDGDGKLNAEERKNAEEAIKNVSVKISLS